MFLTPRLSLPLFQTRTAMTPFQQFGGEGRQVSDEFVSPPPVPFVPPFVPHSPFTPEEQGGLLGGGGGPGGQGGRFPVRLR